MAPDAADGRLYIAVPGHIGMGNAEVPSDALPYDWLLKAESHDADFGLVVRAQRDGRYSIVDQALLGDKFTLTLTSWLMWFDVYLSPEDLLMLIAQRDSYRGLNSVREDWRLEIPIYKGRGYIVCC